MKNKTGITFAIYNNIDLTVSCLRSLVGRNKSEINIVIVDNASTDNSYNIIKKEYPNIIIIRNKKNYGCSVAWNMGIKKCLEIGCEYVVLTQNDVVYSKNCIDNMLSFLENNPSIDIVSPISWNNNVINLSLDEFDSFSEYVINRHNKENGFNFIFYSFMAKRIVFEKCVFDENYKLALYEDSDFYYQIYDNDFMGSHIGTCFIQHKFSATQKIVSNPNVSNNHQYFEKKWGHKKMVNKKDSLSGKAKWAGTENKGLGYCGLLEDYEYSDYIRRKV